MKDNQTHQASSAQDLHDNLFQNAASKDLSAARTISGQLPLF